MLFLHNIVIFKLFFYKFSFNWIKIHYTIICYNKPGLRPFLSPFSDSSCLLYFSWLISSLDCYVRTQSFSGSDWCSPSGSVAYRIGHRPPPGRSPSHDYGLELYLIVSAFILAESLAFHPPIPARLLYYLLVALDHHLYHLLSRKCRFVGPILPNQPYSSTFDRFLVYQKFR